MADSNLYSQEDILLTNLQLARILDNQTVFEDLDNQETEETDLEYQDDRWKDLVSSLLKTLGRLWIATVIVTFGIFIVRKIIVYTIIPHSSVIIMDDRYVGRVSNGKEPLIHQSGETMDDRAVGIQLNGKDMGWIALPALFGEVIKPMESISGPLLPLSHHACTPFHLQFPIVDTNTCYAITENGTDIDFCPYRNETINWIALVERGGCSFEKKMKNLQQAGFKTVLIYNQPRRLPHELVRMSIHSDKLIKSRGIFMSREDGMDLKTRYNSQQVTTITIKHVEELQVQQRLYWKMARDMFIQFVLVFLNVYGFFLMLISFNMVQNYCDNGSVQFLDSLQEAISLILNPDFDFTETLPQTLEYNTLPERQITELDLQTEWKEGGIKGQDVCPICLDQFVINDTARDLPCRHVFHDTCIDPWLVDHCRLCPICKHDVLDD